MPITRVGATQAIDTVIAQTPEHDASKLEELGEL
eukprot:CAMPEP_0202861618 /NCGR_PEP_ID=MMETSP1391-20130828/2957_1 /ASSEMBLY_ACC=CAM_ASM_000867 /TAXON_ID=1034604 /ORGANISM="Chlamydomonas leiostraca, Strain SAG 11-49" /LENGTH=33 /DNA_ID= /DNA_START= /DNA_END= /DNA_ORIENTATION=